MILRAWALLVVGSLAVSLRADDALSVVSYNIRRVVDAPHEQWEDRRPLMARAIRSMRPDVLGVQEALYSQLVHLEQDLKGYRWVGLGRDGGSRDEFCAIFYRSARLELLAFGHFWLSDHPQMMGSITWGTKFPRMCSWARLLDRTVRREFVIFNTHFDHEVQEAREKGAALIRERVGDLEESTPVIVLGDFNARAGTNPAYEILTGEGFLSDTWTAAAAAPVLPRTGTATFNGWGTFPLGDARIDWILTRGPWVVDRAEIVTSRPGHRYPSDHFPVRALLRWGGVASK